MMDCSLPGQPIKAYDSIPTTVRKPTITFHAAIKRARGLYLDIMKPESKTPIAEKANATVPVTILY